MWIDGPSPGSWTGPAEGWRGFVSAWGALRLGADDYRELDGERVLVLNHYSEGRGKTSGVELGQMRTEVAALFHLRDGKVVRLALYWDRERAFADLGLAPESDTARPA